ncbi:hypothetical protein CBM2589_B230100 [Cupriavidus taiwanensis]|uniref:Uncharacterized protein n=1 Tax=Cupriavidus taiwanensis TaxID=164546 RepID=A0A975X000_9BURK|nr:hypothetical protein CBM2589_B230100 [Cupriavidus taiwanensis]
MLVDLLPNRLSIASKKNAIGQPLNKNYFVSKK